MRHYEKKILKNENSPEFLSYFGKVIEVQNEIVETFNEVQKRNNNFVSKINDEIHDFGKKEKENVIQLISPIEKELLEINKKRDSLINQIKDLTNTEEQIVRSYCDKQGKRIDAVREKSMFCYERYVKCVAEQFEKDNIPQ